MFYDTDRCAEFTLPPKRGLTQKWAAKVFRFAAVKKKNFCKDLDPTFQMEKYCTAHPVPPNDFKENDFPGSKI